MAIIHVKFFAESLQRTVPFTAIIPNDCLEVPNIKKVQNMPEQGHGMKTLYMLHGYTGDETDYLMNTRIASLSEKYRIAVIMPAGSNSFYVDDEEGKHNFGTYVGKELVEYTRKLFPLSKRYEDTYIGGLSMGGYGAMRNGFKYAETFSKILAFSGAYIVLRIVDNGGEPFSDEASGPEQQRRIFGNLKELGRTDMDPRVAWKNQIVKNVKMPKIFMTEGSEDFLLDVNRKMRDFLTEQHADLTYVEDAGSHDWDFWNKHLEEAFQFLADV